MKRHSPHAILGVIGVPFLLVVTGPGCGMPAAIEGHPCPCAGGYSCCDGVCVAGTCGADAGMVDSAVPLPETDSGCTPVSSACHGKCGELKNSCGVPIDCGACSNGLVCGGGGMPNVCGSGTCSPSCVGKSCGESNGCSGLCTECAPPSSGNGIGECNLGSCRFRCDPGYVACDAGCCPQRCDPGCMGCCDSGTCRPGNAPSACGMGGESCRVCPAGEHGVATCSSAMCGVACDPGFGDSGGVCSRFFSTAVLFGGTTDRGRSAETWAWDGFNWWNASGPDRPPSREGHAMATLGGKVVLFGGADGATFYGDTWEGRLDTSGVMVWTKRDVSGPSVRRGHKMATLGNHVVLFGGGDGTTAFDDTWEWDGSAWAQRAVSGPSGRFDFAMATVGDSVLVFGGGALESHDMWSWNGTVWTRVQVALPIQGLYEMAGVAGGALLTGGSASDSSFSTWRWDGAAWALVRSMAYSRRNGHATVTLGGKVQLFGGYDGSSLIYAPPDTLEWEGQSDAWSQRTTSGPAPRYGHAMAVLP